MARLDITNTRTIKQAHAYANVTDNTPFVSGIIDTANALGVNFAVHVHAAADADTTITALLEDSDNSGMSPATAVADEYLVGTEAGMALQFDSETKVAKIGYLGHKRYVRLTLTSANNSGNLSLSSTVTLLRANPVGNSTQLATTTA